MKRYALIPAEGNFGYLSKTKVFADAGLIEISGYRLPIADLRFDGNWTDDQILQYDKQEDWRQVLIPTDKISYIRIISKNDK